MSVDISNRQRLLRVNARLLKEVACKTQEILGTPDSFLSIVLVNDAEMERLNATYHDTPGTTDILTFAYPDAEIGGELIISTGRVVEQAGAFGSVPSRELALYVVHGILHLNGHDDQSATDRRKMRSAERRILARLASQMDLGRLVLRSR